MFILTFGRLRRRIQEELFSCFFPVIIIIHLFTYVINANQPHLADSSIAAPTLETSEQLRDSIKKAPKDYVYSANGVRVRELAKFFESMKENHYTEIKEKRNAIISLSEAASKLHFLTDGFSLDRKCNKYVKLINQPNIRTFTTVNLLVNEERHFSETEQSDACILSRLTNERAFDALSKLQTIIQTLDSERVGRRRVSFEPGVQKDLLNCMGYFIYKHQRATSGLVEYIRQGEAKLEPILGQPSSTDAMLLKFSTLLDQVKSIEVEETLEGKNKTGKWLSELSKLQDSVIDNHYEIPKLVQDFLIEPIRLNRLTSCNQILDQSHRLKAHILEIDVESDYFQISLEALEEIVESNSDWLPSELHKFVQDKRQLIEQKRPKRIQDLSNYAKLYNNQFDMEPSYSPELQPPAAIETDTEIEAFSQLPSDRHDNPKLPLDFKVNLSEISRKRIDAELMPMQVDNSTNQEQNSTTETRPQSETTKLEMIKKSANQIFVHQIPESLSVLKNKVSDQLVNKIPPQFKIGLSGQLGKKISEQWRYTMPTVPFGIKIKNYLYPASN